ncbi:acyl-CoA desaturase [bacterium]|nr:acyl-CoA desaturase [bacterium]
MASIHELRDEFAAAGLGKPAAGKLLAKFLLLVGLAAACLVAALSVEPIWAKALIAIVGCWFNVSATMCGHDASHQAASSKRWVNDALAWLAFTTLGGLSNVYWREKHNLKHHPFCNVGSKDPDVHEWPFTLSAEQHATSPWIMRQFHKVQAWAFYPIVFFFMAPALRLSGWTHDLRAIRDARGTKRRDAALDFGFLLLHSFLWLGAPLLLGASWQTVAIVNVTVSCLGGLYLTFVFSPAHMPSPVVSEYHDPLLLQLATTRNLNTNWFFRFTLIGLDQQIEHHLAAKMSHFDLPKARPIVKAFCARHGLPYQESGWLRGLLDTHIRLGRARDMVEIVVGDPPLEPAARMPEMAIAS